MGLTMNSSNNTQFDVADAMRKYRIVPVVMSIFMGYLVWDIWQWYSHLPTRSGEDSAFMGSALLAITGWFKFYVNSGNNYTPRGNEDGDS